jgi:septal ring factor EnvC (AmiA/AmiB activator)
MSIFLNMTTNSRGMLVIGVGVAAFVLAGFSALYSTGNERAMGTGKSIDGQLRDQQKEIELNRAVIGELTKQLGEAEKRRATSREADEITAKVHANRQRISELEKRIPEIAQEIEAGTQALEDEKQQFRKQLLSDPSIHSLAELKTVSGKAYREVRLTSIDATSITFSHQEGSSRVLLKDLPTEIKNRFP